MRQEWPLRRRNDFNQNETKTKQNILSHFIIWLWEAGRTQGCVSTRRTDKTPISRIFSFLGQLFENALHQIFGDSSDRCHQCSPQRCVLGRVLNKNKSVASNGEQSTARRERKLRKRTSFSIQFKSLA